MCEVLWAGLRVLRLLGFNLDVLARQVGFELQVKGVVTCGHFGVGGRFHLLCNGVLVCDFCWR